MKLDDWNTGALPETDPWAVEALKRGLIQPRAANPYTNPDTRPKSTLGLTPERPVLDERAKKYGTITTGGAWSDPMMQTVKELPGKLLTQADENLTKNITALTPKPPESEYGSIRMPRMSDDSMNAGNFVMAGPIAVEQALSKITAKVLPAKTIQDKLLQAGASKAELETRGVTQFLESKGGKPIFPKEVMKHLEENPYQLNEVVKSDAKTSRQVFQLKYPDGTRLGSPFETEEEAIAAMNDLRDPRAALGRGQQEPLSVTETLSERPVSPPKFSAYQTPGGENYRELLLTSPAVSSDIPQGYTVELQPLSGRYDVYGPDRKFLGGGATREEAIAKAKIKPGLDSGQSFSSSHWDEPNVLAHMRVNDRTLPSGEKALHVEEWQSDWANKLREDKKTPDVYDATKRTPEEGRYDLSVIENPWTVYSPDGSEVASYATEAEARAWVKRNSGPETPAHPLVDNWQDLMARRTMKEAVDGGYDRLTWVTGEQTAARYDLSKHFDALHYRKQKDGTFGVVGTTVDGNTMNIADRATAEELPGIIGKDVARRIIAGEGKESTATAGKMRLDGLDLKVGGEWANKLYDESMVNRFNKIGKKYGVQVEDVPVNKADPKTLKTFPTRDEAKKYIHERGHGPSSKYTIEPGYNNSGRGVFSVVESNPGSTGHSLKITPEMKESIGAAKFHPFADLPGPAEQATELWHGIKYPKTFKGFRLEGDPQKWGAVQYSQIDKGANAAPITFYVKPGQDLETRLAEVMKKFEGGKK